MVYCSLSMRAKAGAMLLFACLTLALGISPAHASAQLALYDGRAVASVAYDPAGGAPIRKAAELLSRDLLQLSGRVPEIGAGITSGHGTGVIVGLASSPLM